MPNKTALIVGASGLIGQHCLQQLLNDDNYQQVTALVRRPLGIQHPKLLEYRVDFDRLAHSEEQQKERFTVDDVYCCLGTTIKAAGSQEAFRRVDCDYPVQVAKLCRDAGASQCLIVTGLGSDADSKMFYNRVKGEAEQSIIKLNFKAMTVFQPSLLLGIRKATDQRPSEAITQRIWSKLDFILLGPLKKLRGVKAEVVARAMLLCGKEAKPGVHFIKSDQIQAIYDKDST